MNQIDNFLNRIPPEKAALLHFLRKAIFDAHPKLTERISFGLPFIYGKKGICYFNLKKTGVDVGFMYGQKLPARPEFIVENRKQVCSLFFAWENDVDIELLLAAVKDAVALDDQR